MLTEFLITNVHESMKLLALQIVVYRSFIKYKISLVTQVYR